MNKCMSFQKFVDNVVPALYKELDGEYNVRIAEIEEVRPSYSKTTVLLTQIGEDAPNIITIFNAYFIYALRCDGDFETYLHETAEEITEHTAMMHGAERSEHEM